MPLPERTLPVDLIVKAEGLAASEPAELWHDFGFVIGDGNPLIHSFLLHNDSGRPLRIVNKWLSSTCCLDFGDVPDVVEPGRTIEVPLWVKTAGKSGALVGKFTIRTDSPTTPLIAITLRANLVTSRELLPLGVPERITVDTPGEAFWSLAIRQSSDASIVWPALSGLAARFEGPVERLDVGSGIIEYRRRIVATLDAAGEPGLRAGEVNASWPDGQLLKQVLRWEVDSPLQPQPRNFVVRSDEGIIGRSTTIRSSAGPFRIEGVEGPGIASHRITPGMDGTSTRVDLEIDPGKAGAFSRIVIRTDRPDGRELTLNLIVIAREDHR